MALRDGVVDMDLPGRDYATLTFDGEVVPFTRVLRFERSDAAERYRAFRRAAAQTWVIQWRGRPLLGDKGLYIAIAISVTVPANRLWGADTDNLGKGIVDSMVGCVLKDDRYLSRIDVSKKPARPILGDKPGAFVELEWWTLKGGENGR